MDSMHLSFESMRSFRREGFSHLKLFVKSRSGKREVPEDSASSASTPSPDVQSISEESEISPNFRAKLIDVEDRHKWTVIQTRGSKPAPRFNHAAVAVGRKLVVIGGDTGSETRNDVQMLHLGKLSWSKVGVGASPPSNGLPLKTGPAQELPNCKGHSLISWGKTVILIGGQVDPPADKMTVWSFDLEMDCWTTVVTKGEIPTARTGQSVIRAGSILIMFGGEDRKGRKLNDLHILDLKSLLWLPLHPSGKGPSPRTRHAAGMYDDRFLLIFGGETKSKLSKQIYALDFDNMEWSKVKAKGVLPSPRAGHAGVLVGDKWYIAGGESRLPGGSDTRVLDVSKMEWSVVAPASPDSVASLQGLSVILVQRKERKFLVAFGGCGTQASNAVHVLHITPEEHAPPRTLGGFLGVPPTPDSRFSTPDNQIVRSQHGPFPSILGTTIPCACVNVAKTNLVSVMDQRTSSYRTTSTTISDLSSDLDHNSGLIPLRKRYAMAQRSRSDAMARLSNSEECSMGQMPPRSLSQSFSRVPITPMRRKDLDLPRLRDLPSPAAAGSEGSERQHQSAQSIRGDMQTTQTTTSSVDSGLLSAEQLQITAPIVRPGLGSVDDAGTLFLRNNAFLSSRARTRKGSLQSSEFPGYAEAVISQIGEEHVSNQSVRVSTASGDSNSNMSWTSAGCHSSNSTSVRTTPEYEDEELTLLSKLQKADCSEARSVAISNLTRLHERKLAAAIRKAELLAGQFAESVRIKDEAERTMHSVVRSRQQTERRLAKALTHSKELQEKMAATEQAREEANDLVHNVRMDNLKLEFDLAVKNAKLEEAQMELQETKGLLNSQRTSVLQLQVELLEAKQKLQHFGVRGILTPRVQNQSLPKTPCQVISVPRS